MTLLLFESVPPPIFSNLRGTGDEHLYHTTIWNHFQKKMHRWTGIYAEKLIALPGLAQTSATAKGPLSTRGSKGLNGWAATACTGARDRLPFAMADEPVGQKPGSPVYQCKQDTGASLMPCNISYISLCWYMYIKCNNWYNSYVVYQILPPTPFPWFPQSSGHACSPWNQNVFCFWLRLSSLPDAFIVFLAAVWQYGQVLHVLAAFVSLRLVFLLFAFLNLQTGDAKVPAIFRIVAWIGLPLKKYIETSQALHAKCIS